MSECMLPQGPRLTSLGYVLALLRVVQQPGDFFNAFIGTLVRDHLPVRFEQFRQIGSPVGDHAGADPGRFKEPHI